MGASMTTASAYVADISPPERRAEYFGYMGAAFGVGFIIGPVMGGVLAEFGSRVPFYAAAGVSLVVFVFARFALPESLPPENRRRFRLREANPIGAFTVIGRYPRIGEQRTLTFGLIVGCVCLVALGFANQPWMIFAIIVPYVLGWGLTGPAIQSLVTRTVSADEQGILQGALTSTATASGIIGPPAAGALFGFYIGDMTPVYLPGIAFLVGAVLFLVGLVMHWRRDPPPAADQPSDTG